MDSADRLGIKQRFSAERHYGGNAVTRTYLSYCFRRDRFVDVLRKANMIAFRAVFALSRTGHCHDKFDLFQVLYIWIHHAFTPQTGI